MKDLKAIATLFSGGKFTEAVSDIAENVEWQIYEENMHLQGKARVLQFCNSVAEYFKSITTKFELFGITAS